MLNVCNLQQTDNSRKAGKRISQRQRRLVLKRSSFACTSLKNQIKEKRKHNIGETNDIHNMWHLSWDLRAGLHNPLAKNMAKKADEWSTFRRRIISRESDTMPSGDNLVPRVLSSVGRSGDKNTGYEGVHAGGWKYTISWDNTSKQSRYFWLRVFFEASCMLACMYGVQMTILAISNLKLFEMCLFR